jgi:bisphosphoglycerate-dependent phosphoglycerate mutase
MRASTYQRMAEFLLPPDDPKRPGSFEKTGSYFFKGLDTLEGPGHARRLLRTHHRTVRRAARSSNGLKAASCPGSQPFPQLMQINEFELIHTSWRLNERHYGALQGLNKAETAQRMGEERVHAWRRSYDARPPALDHRDERFPGHDPRYAALSDEELPRAESLKETRPRAFCPIGTECWCRSCESYRQILVTA